MTSVRLLGLVVVAVQVAMQRDKYPERIPFRLTRMLTSAMEVGAIDGHFRATCVGTMEVLRRHKDSVMAMLEAFVHDPLINWSVQSPRSHSGRVWTWHWCLSCARTPERVHA